MSSGYPSNPDPDFNPFQAPEDTTFYEDLATDESMRTGPPWEQPGPVFDRFVRTARGVFGQTDRFFDTMRRSGDYGMPLLYGLLGTLVGAVASQFWQWALFKAFDRRLGQDPGNPLEELFFVGEAEPLVFLPMFLFFVFVFSLLALFMISGLQHLLLRMVGGATMPVETTFRVVCYSLGTTSLFNLIPVCGGVVGTIAWLVCLIKGLARAHEISGGRAALAVFLPIPMCCLIIVLAGGFAGIFAALD